MPRFEFKQDAPDADWIAHGDRVLNLTVRGFGLVLLVVGLIVALTVIVSAWTLYNDPVKIDGFARAVERGSNMDATLSAVAQHGQLQLDTTDRAGTVAVPAAATVPPAQPTFRFSYFVAWFIAILLLLLNGRLAIAAVRTGGELALYDVQVKKLARALLQEGARLK